MRVAVDTLFETPGAGTGGMTYLTSLISAAPAVLGDDSLVALCSDANRTYFESVAGIDLVRAGWSNENRLGRILSQQLLLDRVAHRNGCDVLLGAGNSVPLGGTIPSVVVLHSLQWLFDPAQVGAVRSTYRRFAVEASCHRASRIIAVSQYLADVLVEWRPQFGEKVRTVLEGVDTGYGDSATSTYDPYDSVHAAGGSVILFASTLWPYKNLDVVLRALARLEGASDPRLYICGGDYRGESRRLRALSESLGVSNRVTFLGHVPQSQMPAMYSWADVFVYPSRCESFGLPILEAMSCGTPVVAANTSSIPEVSANAAMLFEPGDFETLAAQLQFILSNEKARTSLEVRGLKRAADLTWERTAADTLAVLREVLS
ncbi:MAG: group 1 glycosyl [Actinobacteria bacterium]|nr:MAG: group 1 glycosyl [Actinomycetota bacterium]